MFKIIYSFRINKKIIDKAKKEVSKLTYVIIKNTKCNIEKSN